MLAAPCTPHDDDAAWQALEATYCPGSPCALGYYMHVDLDGRVLREQAVRARNPVRRVRTCPYLGRALGIVTSRERAAWDTAGPEERANGFRYFVIGLRLPSFSPGDFVDVAEHAIKDGPVCEHGRARVLRRIDRDTYLIKYVVHGFRETISIEFLGHPSHFESASGGDYPSRLRLGLRRVPCRAGSTPPAT